VRNQPILIIFSLSHPEEVLLSLYYNIQQWVRLNSQFFKHFPQHSSSLDNEQCQRLGYVNSKCSKCVKIYSISTSF